MLVKSKPHRGPEHRRSPRRSLGVPAQIDAGDGAPLQACVLSDISATGAKIVSLAVAELPDEFDLLLAGEKGPRRRSTVVWRSQHELGVRFVAKPKS